MELRDSSSTARKQFTGAAIGSIAGTKHLGFGDGLPVYAAQLGAITPTIILLVTRSGAPQRVMLSRVTEVGRGVCAGSAVAWAEDRLIGKQ
jgi:hypothetical protein